MRPIIRADDITALTTRPRPSKYPEIVKLEVGEAFVVPLAELSKTARDPIGAVRSVAWHYGRQLGRKFSTKRVTGGVLIIRHR